jgi:predicted nucleic acid-binding protein
MSTKPLLVVDTNVFINSLWPTILTPNDYKVTELEDSGLVSFAFSNTTANELFKILAREVDSRNIFQCREIFMLHSEIVRRSIFCPTPPPLPRISSDKGDQKFLELAVAVDADYLVTNDTQNGLLSLGQYNNTKILTPTAFLREFQLTYQRNMGR